MIYLSNNRNDVNNANYQTCMKCELSALTEIEERLVYFLCFSLLLYLLMDHLLGFVSGLVFFSNAVILSENLALWKLLRRPAQFLHY